MSEISERGLVAIIFTDAVGSTTRTAHDEDYSLQILLADLDYMRNEAAVRGGTVLKNTGDGLLISFKSAVDAVECALSIQKGFSDREENAAFIHKIGLHIGDVIKKEGDIYGSGVNTASRLVAQCPPGGICVSSTIYELVKQKNNIGNLKAESFQLTNIQPPISAYKICDFNNQSEKIDKNSNKPLRKALSKLFVLLLIIAGAAFCYRERLFIANLFPSNELEGTWQRMGGFLIIQKDGSCRAVWGEKDKAEMNGRIEKIKEPNYYQVFWQNKFSNQVQLNETGKTLMQIDPNEKGVFAEKISNQVDYSLLKPIEYNLTGIWKTSLHEDKTEIFIHQVKNNIFALVQSPHGSVNQKTYVVHGVVKSNAISCTYASMFSGDTIENGTIEINIEGSNKLYVIDSTGGWPTRVNYFKNE